MRYLIYLILVCCFVTCTSNQQHQFDLVISNVNLIDGTGKPIQSKVSIGIKDGRVTALGSVSIEGAKNSIDGTGKFLIPGLFDCHVHTNEFEKDFPRFMHYGVTSIFITGGSSCTNEYYAEMRKHGNQDSVPAPMVFHTSQHFSMEGRHPVKTYQGSWVDGKTIFLVKDTLQIEALVKQVAQYPNVGIKLTIEDGPHPPWVERMPQDFINKIQKEASKNGKEVFAHVSDNIELEMAMDAGIRNIVHWTGLDIDFEKDTVLLKKLYATNPSFITTLMIDKGFLYPLHPEWVEAVRQENVYDEEDFAKIEDPRYLARSEDIIGSWRNFLNRKEIGLKDIMDVQVGDIKLLSENGIAFALGTDTGPFVLPGYSLHEEMQLLEMGGMEPLDIIKMATLNAAEMMHAQDSLGSIENGKLANMVLLDENPLNDIQNTLSINTVFKRGKIQKRIER